MPSQTRPAGPSTAVAIIGTASGVSSRCSVPSPTKASGTWRTIARPQSVVHSHTSSRPRPIARGIVRCGARIDGASGVTNSSPRNMNSAMPTSENAAAASPPMREAPNPSGAPGAAGSSSAPTPKTISVTHIAAVTTISTRANSEMPK